MTLAEIAKVARVSIGTVSLCLNDNHRAAAKTRRRVQEIAREMGYRRDPALSALVAYRTARRHTATYEIVAFLSGWDPEAPSHSTAHRSLAADSAIERAAYYGFELREYGLPPQPEKQMRLGKRLAEQGITGVLLAGTPKSSPPPELPWEEFSTVVLGRSLAPADLDRCCANLYQGISPAVTHLLRTGCRRIGVATPDSSVRWADYEVLAGLQRAWRLRNCVFHLCEPLLSQSSPVPVEELQSWIAAESVEAVLTHNPGQVIEAAEGLGLSIPEDLQVVDLATNPDRSFAGLRLPDYQVGRIGLDLLSSKLHRQERGFPPMRQLTLLDCKWSEGWTVRSPQ